LWRHALWPTIWSLLEKVPVLLRLIVLLQKGILLRHLSGPFDIWWHSILKFLHWFFLIWMTYIVARAALKYPTITFMGSISFFKSSSLCIMKLGSLILGASKLTIVFSFWYILHFIRINWLSLSLLTNLCLMSTNYGYSCNVLPLLRGY
jgi:hypothetical protein